MWLKICGLTDADAVDAAVAAGVDAIGFVFAPSVREVTPAQAAQLAMPARGRVDCVAVTLHPSQALVDEIVRVFQPDVLQADLDDFESLRLPATLARLPVLRSSAAPAACATLPRRLLFEGPRSGSGQTGDWAQAAQLAVATRLVLAGGLDADNVAAAIQRVRPFGVDVSSGVESLPGRKSAHQIHQFVEAARAAFRGMKP